MKRLSLKSKVATKISRSKREVFLRTDFEKLAGYDQIGRALRQLTSDGVLVKVGYGLYARARPNRITGKPMLAAKGGFTQVAEEALSRLGVKWEPSKSVLDYQSGSTQIPANAEVIIFERFNRRIGTEKLELQMARA
ncbi:S-adenosylhomocysteine hydrolase [Aestuariirhabdus haliotis]|jgi:hypothetical protein|uniref:S-adenosylhomocysteine hydrolase n=1 Tax=Aestuariirhabdus haliotis TaxID=2918751 RepID=UPI0020BFB2B0|nr:S-adenosylhomocysteine hydrolase [Aestuariirhabdus haliotis]MCL6419451.1 S-adenosylhomocysteine hydrolase [Aestuariirhabdus haliotis]